MNNSVRLNEDKIVEITVVGNQNFASVSSMAIQAGHLLEQLGKEGKRQLVLDDVTKLGTTDIAARKAVASYAKTLPFKKAAMLGDGSVVMRVGTNLLLRAIGQGARVRYFEDRKHATQWLLAD